jgi:1-deoxy-D-xylulose 5-phosphate reductoisomerase
MRSGERERRGGKEPFSKIIRRVFFDGFGRGVLPKKRSLSQVSVEEALKHPTWKMGRKITLDCATLMNKGFESIEIMNLFGLNYSQIRDRHSSSVHNPFSG